MTELEMMSISSELRVALILVTYSVSLFQSVRVFKGQWPIVHYFY